MAGAEEGPTVQVYFEMCSFQSFRAGMAIGESYRREKAMSHGLDDRGPRMLITKSITALSRLMQIH